VIDVKCGRRSIRTRSAHSALSCKAAFVSSDILLAANAAKKLDDDQMLGKRAVFDIIAYVMGHPLVQHRCSERERTLRCGQEEGG
jgi:hypothetical protein